MKPVAAPPANRPDFCAVLVKLRQLASSLQHDDSALTAPQTATIISKTADAEVAAQAFAALHYSLVQAEQFREAAQLVAFALPHSIRQDTRVQEIIAWTLRRAEDMRDPETELAHLYLNSVCEMDKRWCSGWQSLANRAKAWVHVVRASAAAIAIEYGCGPGLNVVDAALIDSKVQFVGVDISRGQIDACRKLAAERCPRAVFAYDDDESWFNKADCVGLLDCLEHTVHSDTLLEKAECYVRHGGTVFVTTPNGSWAPFEERRTTAGPGQHVAVESVATLAERLSRRGEVMDAYVVPGDIQAQTNSSVCVLYRPCRGAR